MSVGFSDTGTAQVDPSLGQAVSTGLRWSLAGGLATRLGTFAMGLVLARLLTPEDFGVYAVALAAMGFLMHVNDMGLIAATTAWRGDLSEVAPTATTLAFACSVVLYALCWLGAQPFATLAGSPHAAGIVRLLVAAILIDGVTAVRAAALMRSFRQRQIATANVVGMVVQAAVAVGLAVRGADAWSLAIGHVAGQLVAGALVWWFARLRVRPGLDRAVARKLLRFGLPLAGGLGVEVALLNADYVIVGQALGTTALGFYLLAFNVSSWPMGVIGGPIRQVAVPSFSRLSSDNRSLSTGFQRSFALLAACVLPIGLLLALLAPAVVVVLYGETWAPAGPALRYLAILSVVRILTLLAMDALMGAGATRAALWMNVTWGLALIPALVVGTRVGGIRGAAIAHALVGAFVAVPVALLLLRRIGVRLGPLGPLLVRPALAGILSGLVCLAVAGVTSASPFTQLAAAGTTGLSCYVAAVVPRSELRRWRDRAGALAAARLR